MIRTLLVAATLAIACGCTAARKTADLPADSKAAEPKEYKYKDLSTGSGMFRQRQTGGPGATRL